MDFHLDDVASQVVSVARRLGREVLAPAAAGYDQSGAFARPELQRVFDAGLLDPEIPEALGGAGLPRWVDAMVTEELAWGCAGITLAKTANNLGLTPILVAGTREQQQRLLTGFTQKLQFAAFCLTEAGSGSDAVALATRAERVAGGYRLNGVKRFITNGGVADLYSVFATTDPALGARGVLALAVPATTPGVTAGKVEHKLGIRASNTTEVVFEDAFVPEDLRLGAEGDGFKVALRTLDLSRANIAAHAVGIGRRATDEAVRYAKERRQFGRPIIEHEMVAAMLADSAMEMEAAHLLTVQAAWRADQGLEFSAQASMAKAFASDSAMRAADRAVQVFGGYGYMVEYPVEKLFRDAKIYQIFEGTNQIQRMVVARWLAKEDRQ
ncbi:MAG: acyl-CoA dehydrogenase family protein [Sulfobacillus sp.]